MTKSGNTHFYQSKERYRIVIDDELLDKLAEEFLARDTKKHPKDTFLQWVEFRTWEMSNKLV